MVAIVASSGEENIKEKQEAATTAAFAFESRASFPILLPIPLFYKFKLKTRKNIDFSKSDHFEAYRT